MKRPSLSCLLLACGCLLVMAALGTCLLGGAGLYLWFYGPFAPTTITYTTSVWPPATNATPFSSVTPSPLSTTSPLPSPNEGTPTPPISTLPAQDELLSPAYRTRQLFESVLVPTNDPLDLARRLQGRLNLPRNLDAPTRTHQIGDRKTFWVTNNDTNEAFEKEATLAYIGDYVYFWIESGLRYNEAHLKDLVRTFETKIYPRTRQFFGSEWTPGVDGDPRIYILYVRGLGGSIAGYFSSADEYLPEVRPKANGHEMFLLNADALELNDSYTYGVLAHEFQHMIHWHLDRNEETWLNEGFSDLAMLLNQFSVGGADYAYAKNTDIQLNDWPSTEENRSAHYGASFLFTTYFLDRFGEQATQSLVASPENGLVSIDHILNLIGAHDPLHGGAITADDVFADWVIANLLLDKRVGDGRYTYRLYPSAPKVSLTETITTCPLDTLYRDVSQYGVDYLRIRCNGNYLLRFDTLDVIPVLPTDPYSGTYYFYSNRGDESDMTLTRLFDFTETTPPLTFSYWTWYDIEKDYDYVYLLASPDGERWQFLRTPSGSADNPVGNNYGWGYSGQSGDGPRWIKEQIDLSPYSGQQVYLRFEYVTDAAVNGEGFLLDDVSIPEIGYFTDFEEDDGGWQADGFVRIQNLLPQTFRLALIWSGNPPQVENLSFTPGVPLEIPLTFDREHPEVILVVSATARYTRQKALYQITLLPR